MPPMRPALSSALPSSVRLCIENMRPRPDIGLMRLNLGPAADGTKDQPLMAMGATIAASTVAPRMGAPISSASEEKPRRRSVMAVGSRTIAASSVRPWTIMRLSASRTAGPEIHSTASADIVTANADSSGERAMLPSLRASSSRLCEAGSVFSSSESSAAMEMMPSSSEGIIDGDPRVQRVEYRRYSTAIPKTEELF
jgi:hypothetical protein